MAHGVVISFDQRNGFGFIRSRAYPQDVFVHACAVDGGKLLRAGQRVRFEAEPSDEGPRAVRVAPRRSPFTLVARMTPEAAFALSLGAAVIVLLMLGRFVAGWPWMTAWLAAVNPVTFISFALDKRGAILGTRRISETLLLGLALAGGSPAALLAMPVLRHKTQKGAFRLAMAAIVFVQVAALSAIWWLAKK